MNVTDNFAALPFAIQIWTCAICPKIGSVEMHDKPAWIEHFNSKNNSKQGSTNQRKCH